MKANIVVQIDAAGASRLTTCVGGIEMRVTRYHSILFALLIAGCVCSWLASAQSEKAAKKEPWYVRDLPSAAEAAWPKYLSTYGILGPDSEYLPLSCWYKPIRDLDPLYVYHHRVNIVVVQNRKDDIEEGKYICLSISSYRPNTMDAVDGFAFSRNPENGNPYNGVFDFKRKIGKATDLQPVAPGNREQAPGS